MLVPLPPDLSIDKLPAKPTLLLNLKRVMDKENPLIPLTEVLVSEHSICSRLLPIVNLCIHNLPEKFDDIKIATAYCGADIISQLCVGLTCVSALTSTPKEEAQFLRRSIATALVATKFAKELDSQLEPSDIWPFAFLLDIGKLVRRIFDPHGSSLIAHYQRHHRCSYFQAENALAQTPHTLLGALICTLWNLGVDARLTCLHHEEEIEPGPGTLLQRERRRFLMAADRATRMTMGELHSEFVRPLRRQICKLLNVKRDDEFLALMGYVYEAQYSVAPLFTSDSYYRTSKLNNWYGSST